MKDLRKSSYSIVVLSTKYVVRPEVFYFSFEFLVVITLNCIGIFWISLKSGLKIAYLLSFVNLIYCKISS